MMATIPTYHHVDSRGDADIDTDIREWQGRYQRLKDLNLDMQEALEKADDEVKDLSLEVSSLKDDNSRLQKEICGIRSILEEMDNIKCTLMTYKEETYKARQAKMEMEKKYAELEERVEQLYGQVRECQRDNKMLNDDKQMLKLLITDLERTVENKNTEMKNTEEHFKKRESALEELTQAVEEYMSTTEDIKSRIQVLEHCLENISQESVLNKTTEQLAFDSTVNSTLMCEIVEAELEERLLRKYLERQRHKTFGFFRLRMLWSMILHLLWGCFTVLFYSGFLLITFMYLTHLLHAWHPVHANQRIYDMDTIKLFSEIFQPFLELEKIEPIKDNQPCQQTRPI